MADQGKEDVASTLNELERKLRALESDLESAAAEPPPVEPEPAAPPPLEPLEPPETVIPAYESPVAPVPPTLPSLSEGDPEQIVAEARSRISDLRAELDELARTREQIAQTANELVSGYNRALNEPPAAPPATEPQPPAPEPSVETPPAPEQPPAAPPPIPQPLAPEHTIQQGPVAIDAGFFRDLTSLSAFEQSVARVPGVVGVHVRGFAQGRAIIDVQLSHPIALGAEIARHAPLRFTVTEAGPAHLMLAISG